MKIYLGLIFLILSTFIGYRLSIKYSLRKKFYADFAFFNGRLKEEMLFSRKSLIRILSDDERNGIFYDGTKNFFFNKEIPKEDKRLKKDDTVFWREYLDFLGETDAKTQLEKINSVEKILGDRLSECEKEEKKYKNLYIKFGFLIGLSIFIIIL